MHILVAPDKFKGSLSAREVAAAVIAGLAQYPGIIAASCPVADGGEGFADALATRCDPVPGIRDPLGRPITARCGWLDPGTAVLEMSDSSGLHRLTAPERDPWHASTFGVGQLIRHAASHGAARVLVGLGGSATNDAGAGMAAALGWHFLTSDGEPMEPIPANFLAIERIEPPEDDTLLRVTAACDVRNPLLGPEGASHVYARQKGADDRTIHYLEIALAHLADLVTDQLGIDHRLLPGAGAAGGLGYGLATFCRADLQPGFPLVAAALRLEERIAASDLVITGEGRLDSQTLYGKAPAEVARLAKKHGKPVALLCGQCEPGAEAAQWFDLIVPLQDLEPSPALSIRNAAPLVTRAAARIAQWALRARQPRWTGFPP
jgi:glycerate kinase